MGLSAAGLTQVLIKLVGADRDNGSRAKQFGNARYFYPALT
jgi:hypothetical protein